MAVTSCAPEVGQNEEPTSGSMFLVWPTEDARNEGGQSWGESSRFGVSSQDFDKCSLL
ncbi:rCG46473, partial [Rattus norvegicus]